MNIMCETFQSHMLLLALTWPVSASSKKMELDTFHFEATADVSQSIALSYIVLKITIDFHILQIKLKMT